MTYSGLTTIRERIQRISGGELEVVSEIGKGTTVRIILPKEM